MTVTGNSMKPLLLDRVSSVKLSKPDNLKKGDIVLFLRDEDCYVLHRIVAVHDDVYDIVGDNQTSVDKNIPKANIIAKATAYNRLGKGWKETDALYRAILPVIKKVKYFGRKIKRKLHKV